MKPSKDTQLRLSIIVPVYNVEKYLVRCITSLQRQDISHNEYEIIMINDGSTDNSYNIARNLADSGDNIVLLTQDNQGLSCARNTGLKVARGRYIFFVDSDDYIKENSLGAILNVAESNALDICIFKCLAKWGDGTFHDDIGQAFEKNRVFSGEQLLLEGYQVASVWNCLYKMDLIINNDMRFYPRITHEDIEFNNRVYPLAKRVMLIDTICYYYCIHTNTLSRLTSPAKIMHSITSDIDVAAQLQIAAKSSIYSNPIRSLLARKSRSIVISSIITIIRERMLSYDEKLSCINHAKKCGTYPIKGRTVSWRTTLLIPLLNQEFLIKWLMKRNEKG